MRRLQAVLDGGYGFVEAGLPLQQRLGLAVAQPHYGDVCQGDAGISGVDMLAVAGG